MFGLLGNVPGILWVPAHYQWFIYLFSVVPLVVLVPLAMWAMPESPRWLEAHGRHAQAEKIMATLEAECLHRSGLAGLPQPDYARYAVPVNEHVPVRELFRGEYGQRTILLLLAWIIGYAGLVYGFTGYLPVLFSSFGMSASETFGGLLIASTGGGCIGLAISALIGERVERRTSIVYSAVLFCVAMFVLYTEHSLLAAYVLSAVAWGAMTVWLFNMYNYTAAAYPTRLRATGTGLTDGLGHLGSIFGPLIAGALFASTAVGRSYRMVSLHHHPRRPCPGGVDWLAWHQPAAGDPGADLKLIAQVPPPRRERQWMFDAVRNWPNTMWCHR